MDTILIANIINGLGVTFLIVSHTIIGLSASRMGFLMSSIGASAVAGGSLLIISYPVAILNVIWLCISIYGYLGFDKLKDTASFKSIDIPVSILLTLLGLVVILLLYLGTIEAEDLAYYTAAIYIVTYFMFAAKKISKLTYLAWGLIGFALMLPHLIIKIQVAVLISESYSACVSAMGIYLLLKKSPLTNYLKG
jgi:hypothetical protein